MCVNSLHSSPPSVSQSTPNKEEPAGNRSTPSSICTRQDKLKRDLLVTWLQRHDPMTPASAYRNCRIDTLEKQVWAIKVIRGEWAMEVMRREDRDR